MADLVISSLSKEYVRVPVFATEAGVAVDPTGDTVEMAFKSDGSEPGGGDWVAASWESDTGPNPDRHYARIIIGPGGTVLSDDLYEVWVKVTDTPEIIVKKAGTLLVT